jgi:hypothetical protein
MWVVFNATTGNEIDRVESVLERNMLLTTLRANNAYEYEYAHRYEA